MYNGLTLAIPVENPLEVAIWYKDYLNINDVRQMAEDVYEIQITPSIWVQFYMNTNPKNAAPIILRLGVDKLDEIITMFQNTQCEIDLGEEMEGIRYTYSQFDPSGNKVGFYELLD